MPKKTFRAVDPELTEPRERKTRGARETEPWLTDGDGAEPQPTRFVRMDRECNAGETLRAGKKLAGLKEFVDATYWQPDWDAFEMALVAALVHCYFVDSPIWFFIVGPPSTLKTTILDGLSGMQKTEVLDIITPNTLLSGYSQGKKGKPDMRNSLLGRIGREGIVVIPEFGAFLSNPVTASEVSNQLRKVHDGSLKKDVGALTEAVRWQGKLTIIGAMTEKMEWMWSKDAGMGDRFVYVRCPYIEDPWAMGRAAAANKGKKAPNTETLQRFFAEIIEAQYGLGVGTLRPMPSEIEEKIVGLAVLVAELRRAVQANKKDEEVYRAYGREGTGRLATMFCQLADGRASLYRRPVVDEGDLHLVQRVALDSIPWERHALVMEIPHEGKILGKELWPRLQRRSGMTSKSQMRMAVRELEAFGLVELKEDDSTDSMMASEIGWTQEGRELMRKAGLGEAYIKEVRGGRGERVKDIGDRSERVVEGA